MLERQLISLGLAPSEARTYLVGLRQPGLGVQALHRLSGIKRPTLYHALRLLEEKGLAAKKGTGGRLTYVMQPPDRLRELLDGQRQLLEKKAETLESMLPLLAEQVPLPVAATQVQHVETVEGIKALVDEALYCKTKRWDIIAPKRNVFAEMDPAYAKTFLRTRKARGIVARSLWEPPLPGAARRPLAVEDIQGRNPRYLPEVFRGRFSSTMILFDEKALFLPSFHAKQAVLVQSQEIHDLLQMLFEGIWLAATPYAA